MRTIPKMQRQSNGSFGSDLLIHVVDIRRKARQEFMDISESTMTEIDRQMEQLDKSVMELEKFFVMRFMPMAVQLLFHSKIVPFSIFQI